MLQEALDFASMARSKSLEMLTAKKDVLSLSQNGYVGEMLYGTLTIAKAEPVYMLDDLPVLSGWLAVGAKPKIRKVRSLDDRGRIPNRVTFHRSERPCHQ